MPMLTYAYIAYMVQSAWRAHSQTEFARAHQIGMHADGIAATTEAQQRQFAHNRRQLEQTHELGVDMRSWPLSLSPGAVRKQFAKEGRRPLLVLFAPPSSLGADASVQRYTAELKGFADKHFGSAIGGAAFRTGYWRPDCDLNDAAVAELQNYLPDQPMAILGFSLHPGDRVQPQFAYLPGPGGVHTTVQALCEVPIPLSEMIRKGDADQTVQLATLRTCLIDSGFSAPETDLLFGPDDGTNELRARAERELVAAGRGDLIGALYSFSSTGPASAAGIDEAERGLTQALKIALMIAVDAHNLLTRQLPPKLPELIGELMPVMPKIVANSVESAIVGYEQLFDFPVLQTLTSVLIARARLAATRADLGQQPFSIADPVGHWARSRGLRAPTGTEEALKLLEANSDRADAGFIEVIGLLAEEAGQAAVASSLLELSDRRRAIGATGQVGET